MSSEVQVCKVVLVGETQTGKTSIIAKLTQNIFNDNVDSTIVNSISNFDMKLDEQNSIRLVIWDTAGQEKYRSLNKLFYKDAVIVILVYDTTLKSSFEEIRKYWIPQIKSHCGDKVILAIAGNKADLFEQQEVSEEEAQQLASDSKAIFVPTSCKTGSGITELFKQVAKAYVKGGIEQAEEKMKLEKEKKKEEKKKKKSCCK